MNKPARVSALAPSQQADLIGLLREAGTANVIAGLAEELERRQRIYGPHDPSNYGRTAAKLREAETVYREEDE